MFAEYLLEKKKIKVLYKAGRSPLKEGTALTTPHFSPVHEELAVTLRGSMRMAALVSLDGDIHKISDGCQLFWGPDFFYLYFVERKAIWQYVPAAMEKKKWLDLPAGYKDIYFPKVDPAGKYLVFGASAGAHEHDTSDYEIFLWKIGTPPGTAARATFHTGNDNWPDIYIK